MVAGARTFSLEDTLIEPQVLEPPPTRHALFIFLLALAAVLHLATAGWGDLYDGVEGQFAGGAREMLATQQWLVPTNDGVPRLDTPPLVYWLIVLSYKIFGVTATAARLPIALAMIASIALTFLIGERLAGYWRGFAAGLIHLCSGGAFLLGRAVTPEPVFSAFLAGAIFCAVCGYQRRQFRRGWFAGVWLCTGLACLSKGLEGLFLLAGICVLLAVLFREARLRLRFLLHWSYLLFFILLVAPWYVWAQNHFPGFFLRMFSGSGDPGLPGWQFLVLHLVWWFPASILVLPGLFFATRKILRAHEFSFAEALPLGWMAVGFLPLLLPGHQTVFASMSLWSAFALCAALVWERTPPPLRLAGLCFLLLAGAAAAVIAFFAPEIIRSVVPTATPFANWMVLRPLLEIAALALAVFALAALFLARRPRSEIALLLVLASMVPIGLCLAEGASRIAPAFSLAGAARSLNPLLEERGEVLFEGPLRNASSLTFYLPRKFYLVNQEPDFFDQSAEAQQKYLDENFVLEAWNRADPIYLIIDERRVPHWQELVTARVHIYHQVTTCGRYVVLSNQL
jgi:4-amino-4-deoxy-L-arabinose transferase-like glycosyltransferase